MSTGRKILTFLLSLTVFALFLLNYVAMFIIIKSGSMSGSVVPFYVIAIPLIFVDLLPAQFEIYWIAILAIIITIVVAFIIRDFILWIGSLNKKEMSDSESRFGVFAELIVVLISVTYLTYFISMAITNSSNPFGNPTSSAPTNYLLLTLLHAPVWEEFVYRALILGIPLYLISYRNKIPFYRAIVGGKFEIDKTSVTILIISAFFFGSAHLISWEPAKFPSAFFAGIVLGYLFMRYGIYMSIAGHFIIDFMGSYSYINSPIWNAITILSSLILLLWFVAGFPYYWYYLREIFSKKYVSKEENKTPEIQENQNYILGYKVICPNCGYDQHRVLPDGRFQCLKCGTVFYYNKK